MIRVAARPQWVLFLLFVMVVAAAFAWLGKWQVERAVEAAKPVNTQSEIVVPLTQLTAPGVPIVDTAGAHMTTVTGVQVPDSFTILTGRLNFGTAGYWVVGRVITQGQAASAVSLPVAYGWAATPAQAEQALATLNAQALASQNMATYTGRFMPAEAPLAPGTGEPATLQQTLAPAALINQWPGYQGSVYWGYLIENTAPAGLAQIESKPPIDENEVNWLNIFYAIEWMVFAGFAFYIWWRLVKDAWEREQEIAALDAAQKPGNEPADDK